MTTTSRPTPAPGPASTDSGRRPWQPGIAVSALVGVVAMGLAIAVAELISALGVWLGWLSSASSAITSLGNTFIKLTPEWLKEYAIRTFGSHDKDALRVGMYVTLLIVALIIGVVAKFSPRIAAGITVVLIAVTLAAIFTTTGVIAFDALPIIVGGVVGIYLLVTVFRRTVDPALLGGSRPAGKASVAGSSRTVSSVGTVTSDSPAIETIEPAEGNLYDSKPGSSGDQHPMALAGRPAFATQRAPALRARHGPPPVLPPGRDRCGGRGGRRGHLALDPQHRRRHPPAVRRRSCRCRPRPRPSRPASTSRSTASPRTSPRPAVSTGSTRPSSPRT